MKLGPVRWQLKKSGSFLLSADKSRLVVGDVYDSTISVIDVETGQIVRTFEQQHHNGNAQTGKRTSLIIDGQGRHVAINYYHHEIDSLGWMIVNVEDGQPIISRREQFAIKSFSTIRDRLIVYNTDPRATVQLTIRRLSDNSVIKQLSMFGWSEYEEETGRLFVVADRVIRAFDISSGDEVGQWEVVKSDVISKDPGSDWIYASTRISSGSTSDLNLVECVNISTNERRTFSANAFARDCPYCLELGRLHHWSTSAQNSYLFGSLQPGQYNMMWQVDAVDSSVRIWLNPQFYFDGWSIYHEAVYLDESKRYIHMGAIDLEGSGLWCHDVVPNTTSNSMDDEERDYIEVVEEDLFVRQSGSSAPISAVVVTSIDGSVIHRHDVGPDLEVPIRIQVGALATGLYVCTIVRAASACTQTFTVIR